MSKFLTNRSTPFYVQFLDCLDTLREDTSMPMFDFVDLIRLEVRVE